MIKEYSERRQDVSVMCMRLPVFPDVPVTAGDKYIRDNKFIFSEILENPDRQGYILNQYEEELRIIIAAAEAGGTGGNIPDFEGVDEAAKQALNGILINTRPIEINENSMFEICFHDYIIYQIRNESFCSYAPEEIRHGRYLVIFEKSELLSRLCEITDARQFDDGGFYPGKWTHYGICTQRHVIDVIARCPPAVSRRIK